MDDARGTAALVALLRASRMTKGALSAVALSSDTAESALVSEHGLLAEEALASAQHELETWRARGIHALPAFSKRYPHLLKQSRNRPPLLFARGDPSRLGPPLVAVVGTRRATRSGLETADKVAADLVRGGFAVVSGLAAGIDTAAHTAALDAGGDTIAVLGSGLDHVYPPQNARLQERIAGSGLLLSQFLPETRPSRHTFPLRNAVIAALSEASVIVEGAPSSGTELEARLALAEGRAVFLLEALLEHAWAMKLAENPDAEVVGSAAEVVPALLRRHIHSAARATAQ